MIRCSIWDESIHRKGTTVLERPKSSLYLVCFLAFKTQSVFDGGVLNGDTKLL
jgi:hypothetical protein